MIYWMGQHLELIPQKLTFGLSHLFVIIRIEIDTALISLCGSKRFQSIHVYKNSVMIRSKDMFININIQIC